MKTKYNQNKRSIWTILMTGILIGFFAANYLFFNQIKEYVTHQSSSEPQQAEAQFLGE